jgi:hypothetical protein
MTRRKTVCRIQYEDRRGNLQTAKIRLPAHVALNRDNLRKLLHARGHFPSMIVGETCTFYGGKGKQIHLPHVRKKK